MAVLGCTAAWCPQERRYAGLKPGELPICESLKDTIARALPFWNEEIAPQIKAGKRVLIAAHGNSLRGIVKHLEGEVSLTCCMGGSGGDTGPYICLTSGSAVPTAWPRQLYSSQCPGWRNHLKQTLQFLPEDAK